jgi:phosphinothricin acetyltransferase
MIDVERLEPSHHADVLAIYNHYVATSPCTFDTEPFDLEARSPWFRQFDGAPYECLVAVEGSTVAGYACTAPFKPKPAYRSSVEVSVYLDDAYHGRGVGSRLYEDLFAHLETTDIHRAYAGITLPNPGSLALHEKFGFSQAGLFREVGHKFERYWDVVWLEKSIVGSALEADP